MLYDLRSEKIISKDNYLTDLNRRHLELVLHTNPNPSGSVTKILRTIFTKQVKSLGPELCHFLHHELTKNVMKYGITTMYCTTSHRHFLVHNLMH